MQALPFWLLQTGHQSIQKIRLTLIDLASGRRNGEELAFVNFRKFPHPPGIRWPFKRKGIAIDSRQIAVALKGPRIDALT